MNIRMCMAAMLVFCGVAAAAPPSLYLQGGYRFGSSTGSGSGTTVEHEDGPAWGVLTQFSHAADSSTAIELYVSHGSSAMALPGEPQMEVTHVQLGGIKYIEPGWARPFVGLSVGMSYFRLDDFSDTFRPAYALYGGVEWPLAAGFSLRAEMRWLGVYFDEQTKLACATGCSLDIAPGTRSELEAQLGLGFNF